MSPAPSTARLLTTALLLATAAAGCTGTPPPHRTPAGTPAPRRTTPAHLCATLVAYWADVTLVDGRGAGLDWEQKGLSQQQYAIHDTVVAAARAERARHGLHAARALIGRQAHERCTAAHGATASPGTDSP